MKLKQSLLIAVIISLIGLIIWESYWRTKPEYYRANVEDDRYLWAQERAKLEKVTKDDVVIIGSSRTGFNFNTHEWEETQGYKPINLTANGKPPGPFLEDIVYNTEFNGTLIIGITPLMWFGSKDNQRWRDANQWVLHYQNQTYAQKLGFHVGKPLQRNLVFLTSSELNFYNDLDLKSLINTLNPESSGLLNFGYNDEDRNLYMYSSMVSNPKFAEKIQAIWSSFIPSLPEYEKVKDGFSEVFKNRAELIAKFKARGGKIIFVRHKAEEKWNSGTKRMMPRDKVYDKFIDMVDCPSYHFEDYEFMSKHTLPDWSHMNAVDAKVYTKNMVNQLIKDNHLTKLTN